MPTPEEHARETIDRMLTASGWIIQDRDDQNLSASPGVEVREFPIDTSFADYLLFANGRACGVV